MGLSRPFAVKEARKLPSSIFGRIFGADVAAEVGRELGEMGELEVVVVD